MTLRVSSSSSEVVTHDVADAALAPADTSTHAAPEAATHDSLTAHPATSYASSADFESPISMNDDLGRQMLVASSPQECDIGTAAKNGDRVCGGAALMNALILSSDSKDACKANAQALEQTAREAGAQKYLPPSVKPAQVDRALEAFKAGEMKPTDVQVLQQLAYATSRAIQGGQDTGTSVGAMAVMAGELQANGANLAGARFTEIQGEGGAHWLAEAHGIVANSSPPSATPVDDAPAIASANWNAEVAVSTKPNTLHVSTRGGGQIPVRPDGDAYRFDLDPRTFRSGGKLDLMSASRAIRQGIAQSTP